MAISGAQPALMFAQSGVARAGATRWGYMSGLVFVSIAGIHIGSGNQFADAGLLLDTLTITDELDETPNRATFRLYNAVPLQGQDVVITLGSKNNRDRLFAGHVLSSTQQHRAQFPDLLLVDVNAIDYTWQLGFLKVTEMYTNASVSTIAVSLITRYAAANGFTATNIDPTLPILDEITFTNEDLTDCLTRLVRRIGAYWYVDYRRDVHMFFEETLNGAPTALTSAHRSLSAFTFERDRTQALSRVYVEGRGARVLVDVYPNRTTVPLETVDMFGAAPDVSLKASQQGAIGGSQLLTFTGVVEGGGVGSLIGTGVKPTSAPGAVAKVGAGIEFGIHQYAYTWVTATGETIPSPLVSVTHVSGVPAPTVPMTGRNDKNTWAGQPFTSGIWDRSDVVDWAYAYAVEGSVNTTGPIGPIFQIVSTGFTGSATDAAAIVVEWTDGPYPYTRIFHRVNGGPWRCWFTPKDSAGNGVRRSWTFFDPAINSQTTTPPASSPTYQQTTLSGVALGPATVTSRKLYRTSANQSQLKLLTTIANNTATTYTDAAADATLGANAPTGDTSALAQPDGQVNPGATTVPVASIGPFEPGGGWATAGGVTFSYGGVSGSLLVGVPGYGPGMITAALTYGTTITATSMLIGVSGIVRTLVAGDELYLVVTVDSPYVASQLALMGGNGIREEWVQDRRLSIPEARARGTATLQLRPLDDYRVSYVCRDVLTASGKTIAITLGAPFLIDGEFKIQQVTIANFRPHPKQQPTYTVQASTQWHSFEDLLRRARYKE